jgi:hypothetical protein
VGAAGSGGTNQIVPCFATSTIERQQAVLLSFVVRKAATIAYSVKIRPKIILANKKFHEVIY